MELVLIRHTRTNAVAGTCYGHLDVPLHCTHAQDIATALAGVATVDTVFSSPSQRCVLLAKSLAERDRCPLILAEALRELNFGAWEGRVWAEIPRFQSDHWAENPWERAPPGGETEQALWNRVDSWRQQTLQSQTGRIAIVGHGGSLRALRCLLLQLAPQQRWEWQIGFGESVRLAYPPDRS